MEPQDDFLGRVVSHYTLSRVIGEGATGRVYLGDDPLRGTQAAIKILVEPGLDASSIGRFFDEAKAIGSVLHPNIVEIFEIGTLGEQLPYLVMELLQGETLGEYLRRMRRLPVAEVLSIGAQIADALDAAHEVGIVHRDLKPENIFLAEAPGAPTVKLLDFGLAKLVNQDGAIRHTKSGVFLGTPQYMSPEQADRPRSVDGRSDIYSLGIILFELATGQVPFRADTVVAVLFMHHDTAPPAPSSLVPGLPPALEEIILRCLEKAPEQRYQTAGEVARALLAVAPEDESTHYHEFGVAPPSDFDETTNARPQEPSAEEFGEIEKTDAVALSPGGELRPVLPGGGEILPLPEDEDDQTTSNSGLGARLSQAFPSLRAQEQLERLSRALPTAKSARAVDEPTPAAPTQIQDSTARHQLPELRSNAPDGEGKSGLLRTARQTQQARPGAPRYDLVRVTLRVSPADMQIVAWLPEGPVFFASPPQVVELPRGVPLELAAVARGHSPRQVLLNLQGPQELYIALDRSLGRTPSPPGASLPRPSLPNPRGVSSPNKPKG